MPKVPADALHRRVKVTGWIAGDGGVHYLAAGSEDEVDGPHDLPEDAFALQVRSGGSPFDRWLAFLSGQRQPPPAARGSLALLALADGRTCLGHVRIGYKAGSVNVHFAGQVQENVTALWAMRVLWLKPFGGNRPS